MRLAYRVRIEESKEKVLERRRGTKSAGRLRQKLRFDPVGGAALLVDAGETATCNWGEGQSEAMVTAQVRRAFNKIAQRQDRLDPTHGWM